MKIVLVTTTINVPNVLREYRRLGPSVPFIIAGDQKAPHNEIEALCLEIGKASYLGPEEQEGMYPGLSEAIGWNNVQRRNIAILEAAKLEPDIIVSVDDDNWPTSAYFREIREAFERPHYGYLAKGDWFNIGNLAISPFTYRGFPDRYVEPSADYGMNGQQHHIGILNGLIFGDPDVNAVERFRDDPKVKAYAMAAQAGISVNPDTTWTPVNAQNTAYRAELAPLMLQLPHVGRGDDILGSYIAQRVLQGTDLHVRFGQPFVKQKRNYHDPQTDIRAEEFMLTYGMMICDHLKQIEVPRGTVVERLSSVLDGLGGLDLELPHAFFDEWIRAWV